MTPIIGESKFWGKYRWDTFNFNDYVCDYAFYICVSALLLYKYVTRVPLCIKIEFHLPSN